LRKLVVLLALAVSGLFLTGATPALASNCTPVVAPTYYAGGLWHFQAQLQNCTDVDQMQFSRYQGVIYPGSGWLDVNHQNGIFQAPSAYNLEEYLFGRVGVLLANSGVVTWSIPPWCSTYGYPPGYIFPATRYFAWRIHSNAQKSWGIWHQSLANENIGC
jgi:hypothetical protein